MTSPTPSANPYQQRPFSPSSHYILITGASRGIGAQLARHLASQNANLVLLARNSKGDLDSLAQELREKHKDISIHAFSCDVSKHDVIKKTFEEITKVVPHLDIVVANSGIMPGFQCGIDEVDDELDLATFRTNVEGYHFTTKYAMPLLWKSPKDGYRTIAYVASSAGWLQEPEPAFGMISYCTSKTASNGIMVAMHKNYVEDSDLAKQVRKSEDKKLNRVVAIHPGFVQTGLGKETWEGSDDDNKIAEQKKGFGAIDIEAGVDTLLWSVTAQDGVESGKTYSERKVHSF